MQRLNSLSNEDLSKVVYKTGFDRFKESNVYDFIQKLELKQGDYLVSTSFLYDKYKKDITNPVSINKFSSLLSYMFKGKRTNYYRGFLLHKSIFKKYDIKEHRTYEKKRQTKSSTKTK